MKFAVIAAGEGSRLAEEGVKHPKPLVELHGEAMIARLVRIFKDNGAEEIDIIVNTIHPETREFVRRMAQETGGNFIRVVEKPPQDPCKVSTNCPPSWPEHPSA